MAIWWVLFGLVMVGGLGSAAAALWADRKPKADEARRAVEAWPMGVAPVGLLSGGPVRAIDARLVDFVERGLVRAEAGKLIVAAEMDDTIDAPLGSTRVRGLGPDDVRLLRVVREHGGDGLDAVRRRAPVGALSVLFGQLARQGLLITPLRRTYGPMKIAYPVLLAFLPWFAGVLTLGVETADEFNDLDVLSLFGWFGVPIAGALIYARKDGYRGPSPVSSRPRRPGTARRRAAAGRLPGSAGRARRIRSDDRCGRANRDPGSRGGFPVEHAGAARRRLRRQRCHRPCRGNARRRRRRRRRRRGRGLTTAARCVR
ncbi:hypothetical protein [Phytoactinopolyspora halotolerans]|uniref:Uncharacterized protein n=1 Tax=Phytoactinopolyspora halotolerans TaxID=1981512 RepID=A0A6L9S946_9ACTN|nr:hypothetical protein [Phytoactinopolyspora halotolerans]NEE01589.1 hypothetical protein [Phytoactinopolyspora halotolerans]